MLPHVRSAVEQLAARCASVGQETTNGWSVDWWELQPDDIDYVVELYASLLRGGRSAAVQKLLADRGIDLDLHLSGGAGKDDITRSDLTELVAAASLVARDGWSADALHMPNVPKMARRKSDSGIDVMGVVLEPGRAGFPTGEEKLLLVSVKHTVTKKTSNLRSALVKSVTDDLSRPYLATQCRVLSGNLIRQGLTEDEASRVYLFLDLVSDVGPVDVLAVGVADGAALDDFRKRVGRLPSAVPPKRFRGVVMPGLKGIASRCP